VTINSDNKEAALAIVAGNQPDLEPAVKRELAAATAKIYEALRDFPPNIQVRVIVASAVLLECADDVVAKLTGKTKS
jgi:hypothetical protein